MKNKISLGVIAIVVLFLIIVLSTLVFTNINSDTRNNFFANNSPDQLTPSGFKNGDFHIVNTVASDCDQTISNPASFNWNGLSAGDVICLANGTLTGGINISARGTANNPIVIRGSGNTTLNGGRTALLAECGSSGFGRDDSDHEAGIVLNGSASHIIFENFDIEGFWRNGIYMDSANANNITFRNMRVENNGTGWNGPGVQYAGSNMLFENMTILDNAQDAFQTDHYAYERDVSLTVRNSVIGNTRRLSSDSAKSFNDCTHADGLQVHAGGNYDLTFESVDIVGVTNGFMLGGDNRPVTITGRFDDVFIFAYENGFRCKPNNSTTCRNFDINNMVLYSPNMVKGHDIIRLDGNGHTMTNSAFIGTSSHASARVEGDVSRVCMHNMKNNSFNFGTVANPQMVDLPSRVGDLDFEARITNSLCRDNSQPTSTPAPTNNPEPSATPTPLPSNNGKIEAENFSTNSGFNDNGNYITESESGQVTYQFNLEEAGSYNLRMHLNAPDGGSNSLYLNINSNPGENNYYIWDIVDAVSENNAGRINSVNDFYTDTVSWRADDGSYNSADPDFDPVEFDLDAGNHTLYLNGREGDLKIDYIELVEAGNNPNPTNTPTNTPIPTATNTPVPTATNTPVPTATNTPIPTATNTPVPTATNTPIPTATNTPAPTPVTGSGIVIDAVEFSSNDGFDVSNSDFIIARDSGSVVYDFNIVDSGVYNIIMDINAPSPAGSSNSVYINIDSDPGEDDYFVWDTEDAPAGASLSSFYSDTVSWRGEDGTFNEPGEGLNPVNFVLDSGNHKLYVNAREDNLRIDSIKLVKVSDLPTQEVLRIEAEEFDTNDGFSVEGDFIRRNSNGGATYNFTLNNSGLYTVRMYISSPPPTNRPNMTGSSNSAYVSINDNPDTNNFYVWDTVDAVTEFNAGRIDSVNDFMLDTVTWRGDNGNYNSPDTDYDPVYFDLNAGNHTLYVNTREARFAIDYIEIVRATNPSVSIDTAYSPETVTGAINVDTNSEDAGSRSSSSSSSATAVSADDVTDCTENYFGGQTYVTPLSDIQGTTFESDIVSLHCKNVVNGFSEGDYRPTESVERYAMAKFIVEAFQIPIDNSSRFSDIPSDNVFSDFANTLKATGISKGDRNGDFNGEDLVTRGQAIAFMVRAMDYKGVDISIPTGATSFVDLEPDDTFYAEARFVEDFRVDGERIINGYADGTIRLEVNINRGEMSKIINKASQ